MLTKVYLKTRARVSGLFRSLREHKEGSSYMEVALIIITVIVLGALVLGVLYALFKNTVLPNISSKISDMFNYAG